MSDEVQEALARWASHEDRAALLRAVDGLCQEWRPRIRRLLRHTPDDQVEDLLQEALEKLVLRSRRALAPSGATAPRGWRATVLKNFLRDEGRRQLRRAHAEEGLARGLSPQAEAEAWRRRKAGERVELGAPPPEPAPEGWDALAQRRRAEVLAALGRAGVVVRRRVILGLALDFDTTPWAEELAAALDEAAAATLGRMITAQEDPARHQELLTLPRVRVPWPLPQPEPRAREAARKALERGQQDLASWIAKEDPCA